MLVNGKMLPLLPLLLSLCLPTVTKTLEKCTTAMIIWYGAVYGFYHFDMILASKVHVVRSILNVGYVLVWHGVSFKVS